VIGWGLLASGVPYCDLKENPDLVLEAAQRLENGSEMEDDLRNNMDTVLSHASSSKQARRDRIEALCKNRNDIDRGVAQLGKTMTARGGSPKPKKTKQDVPAVCEDPPMPFNQVRSMFSEKMKAIMMQDRGLLRKIFQKNDKDNKGVLNPTQFHDLGVEYELGLSPAESRNFMVQYTSGKPFMSFQDFFQNLLGFPHDFFSMKFDAKPKPEKNQQQLVKKLPKTTTDEKLASLFVRSLRKELYDVHQALTMGLTKERLDTHLTSSDVYRIFHCKGIELSKIEIQEIIDHYDFDCDGKIDYNELVYELLDLPLPKHVRDTLPAPRRTSRPPLGPRTKSLMEMLRQQCRRCAVSNSKLDHMFSVYDKDGSGSIAYDEVQGMVKEFHLEASGKDAAAVILDRFSPAGAMTYEEFCTDVVGLPQGAHQVRELDPEEERLNPQKLRESVSEAIKGKIYRNPNAVKKAFVMFDKDFGGSVSWPEFRDGFTSLGLPASKAQMKQLFNEFGPNGGQLSVKPWSRQLLGLDEDASPNKPSSRRHGGTPQLVPPGSGRPRSSLEALPVRGASKLSITPGARRVATADAALAPSQYLIRSASQGGRRTPDVLLRRPGTQGRMGSMRASTPGVPKAVLKTPELRVSTPTLEPIGEVNRARVELSSLAW